MAMKHSPIMLTPAQTRVMQCVRRTGKVPSNTTKPLVSRLLVRDLIRKWDGKWTLTEAGENALNEVEIREACSNLKKGFASLV